MCLAALLAASERDDLIRRVCLVYRRFDGAILRFTSAPFILPPDRRPDGPTHLNEARDAVARDRRDATVAARSGGGRTGRAGRAARSGGGAEADVDVDAAHAVIEVVRDVQPPVRRPDREPRRVVEARGAADAVRAARARTATVGRTLRVAGLHHTPHHTTPNHTTHKNRTRDAPREKGTAVTAGRRDTTRDVVVLVMWVSAPAAPRVVPRGTRHAGRDAPPGANDCHGGRARMN